MTTKRRTMNAIQKSLVKDIKGILKGQMFCSTKFVPNKRCEKRDWVTVNFSAGNSLLCPDDFPNPIKEGALHKRNPNQPLHHSPLNEEQIRYVRERNLRNFGILMDWIEERRLEVHVLTSIDYGEHLKLHTKDYLSKPGTWNRDWEWKWSIGLSGYFQLPPEGQLPVKIVLTDEDKKELRQMFTDVVNTLSYDAHTVTPPLMEHELWDMAPDYLDIHGNERKYERVLALWHELPHHEQTRIRNCIMNGVKI